MAPAVVLVSVTCRQDLVCPVYVNLSDAEKKQLLSVVFLVVKFNGFIELI